MIAQVDADILQMMQTNKGENVRDLSLSQPVLLVFLRHFGCVFCKEALDDLSKMTDKFDLKKVKLVLVHMSEPSVADPYFANYKLSESSRISDPELNFYTRFGLIKGGFSQLYGLGSWMRGFSLQRQGFKSELAKQLGDSTQMPGIFTIRNGEVVDSYIHKRASEKPDYDRLLGHCSNGGS